MYCCLFSTSFNFFGLRPWNLCILSLLAASLFVYHQTVGSITVCYPERSDIKYTWMPSPVYANMVNLIVSFTMRRRSSKFTNVTTGNIVPFNVSMFIQSKTLRKVANAPWYISNVTFQNDLRIPYVTEVIRTYAKNHKKRTAQNNNQLIRDLFNQPEIRRINRMWPEDLIR
jgi:hypothetical protein